MQSAGSVAAFNVALFIMAVGHIVLHVMTLLLLSFAIVMLFVSQRNLTLNFCLTNRLPGKADESNLNLLG